MRLIYLYTENDGEVQFSLNFDSDYHCELSRGVLTVKHKSVLPDGFFRLNVEHPVVTSVSAIVGKNGSGKTAVARVIREILCAGENCPEEYAVVLEAGNGVECFTSISMLQVEGVDKDHVWREDEDETCLFDRMNLVYISPNFTPGNSLSSLPSFAKAILPNIQMKVTDLSSAALFYECVARCRLQDECFEQGGIAADPVALYERITLQRMLELQVLTNNFSENADGPIKEIPPPYSLLFSHDEMTIRDAVSYVRKAVHSDKIVGQLNADFGDDVFMWCANSYMAALLLDFHALDADGYDSRKGFALLFMATMLDATTEWKRGGKHRQRAHQRILDALYNHGPRFEWHPDLDGECEQFRVSELFCEIDILGRSLRHLDDEPSSRSVSVQDAKRYARVLRLLEMHFSSKEDHDYMRFTFGPPYPAGMTASLFLWARLFEYFGRYAPSGHPLHTSETNHVLVFIDEAEQSLHPELQRNLISDAITFFEHIDHGIKFHLVFATHSPLILSDVPCGNVARLGEGRELPQTFAANIYDLYRLSFFLKSGTMGAFAAHKLNGLLKNSEGEDAERILNLIGDERLKAYFADMRRVQ